MAEFSKAWKITAENEGADSSYDQATKWGITKEFLQFHKLKNPASDQFIKSISVDQAGVYVKKVISDKIFNNADRINDQSIYNLIIDYGFNKPAFCIKSIAKVLGRDNEVKQALKSLKIPDAWIVDINSRNGETTYKALWAEWWDFTINSGTFIKGAAGLANRLIRYQDYGKTGVKDNNNVGAKKALAETTNQKVRAALTAFLKGKKGLKVQNNPELNADTEGGYTKPVLIGIALYFGYEWYKKRRR